MRETKKNTTINRKRSSKKIKKNLAGMRKWAYQTNPGSVNMSAPMSNSSYELFDIGKRSLDVNNIDKIREIFDFNVCAIYSNPIFLTRPVHDEITSRTHKLIYIDHAAPLRTPCQEMKALSLNSESKNLKFLPAAEKKDIFKILEDESNFDPEILFITCHGHNNKILCEDANGRFVVFKNNNANNSNRLFISEQLAPDYYKKAFISQEEFVNNIIESGKLNNLKLLFLNACKMHKFGEFVSKKLPNIYVICWNTDAEDVACLDFLKKLITAINELSSIGKKIIDENVYKKAAESFIEDYGKKYNVDRIQDPHIFMKRPDLLQEIRPSGLNCLFHKGEQIESLDLIKQRLVREKRYNKYKPDKPPPLIDRPHSAPNPKSSARSTRKVSIKGKSL